MIERIAAGQVVERPVSIVKELVENSLDAGAQNISIRLEDGGKTKIVVTDDGCGIQESDLEKVIEQHTTSKIQQLADLQKITSFGFRGEALWSITKVAKVILQSRRKESTSGRACIVKNGLVLENVPVGMQTGTIITITELFETYPARKKFLKSNQVEFQYVLEIVNQLSLAHATVGFQLFNNDKLILDYLPNETLQTRITTVFGKAAKNLFLPLSAEGGDYKIRGFIGSPQAATTIALQQILIVNKRPVSFLPITKTIKHAFGTLLPKNIHPPFVIEIETDPELFDINIHPRKEKIAFSEQQLLVDILHHAVTTTLKNANLSFSFYGDVEHYELHDSGMDDIAALFLKSNTKEWNVKNYFEDEPILQVKKLYLIAQTKDGLLLVDQHAAHERILYDQFSETYEQVHGEVVVLPKPVEIELSVYESEVVKNTMDFFEQLGFVIKNTKPTTFIIQKVPIILQNRNLQKYFVEIIADIVAETKIPELDDQTHRTIAYVACRSAIKAGEVLTQPERKNLIEKLLTTKGRYTCPHGRPAYIVLNMTDLAQLFHRIPASQKEK